MAFRIENQVVSFTRSCQKIFYCMRSVASVTGSSEQAAWESAKPYSDIPGPISVPILGTSWTFLPLIGRYKLERQNEVFEDKKKRYGSVYKERFGPMNMVISSNAQDMETISKNEGKYPSRGPLKSMKKYRELRKDKFKRNGIMIMEGYDWWELRQKIQKHMLKPTAAERYLDATQSVASDFVNRIFDIKNSNSEIPGFNQELYKWALESIAYVGLDSRLGCLDSNLSPDSDGMKMIQSVLTQFNCMYYLEDFSGGIKLWKYFSTPMWKKFVDACDVFSDIAFKNIVKAMDELKTIEFKDDDQMTVLQALLLKEDLDPADAVTFLSDMLMAGIETTSNTMAFFLYNMARFPKIQELLYKEVKKFLPTSNDKMTNEIYSNLRYLRACLKESMRHTPTIGGMLRLLTKDSVIGGYKVPTGTYVISAFTQIYHDEKYFEKPKEFLPDRWLSREDGFNPFAFVPFGFGTRSCIGRRIAELEMICLIAEIIRNFEVQYHYEDIGVITKFVNTPDKPLRFSFIKR